MAKRIKGRKERRLFEELSAGIDAMRDHREGRLQPRTHIVQPQHPAVHAEATTAWEPRPMVYTLKVTLMETDPPIWRRLRVAGRTTLARLDRIIQTAMGWTNSHLHSFTAGGVMYGDPTAEWETKVRNERRARLAGIASEPGRLSSTSTTWATPGGTRCWWRKSGLKRGRKARHAWPASARARRKTAAV